MREGHAATPPDGGARVKGYVGILVGVGVALTLVAGASSGSTSTAPRAFVPEPGTPHASEQVVEGHTTYAVLEIDDADYDGW